MLSFFDCLLTGRIYVESKETKVKQLMDFLDRVSWPRTWWTIQLALYTCMFSSFFFHVTFLFIVVIIVCRCRHFNFRISLTVYGIYKIWTVSAGQMYTHSFNAVIYSVIRPCNFLKIETSQRSFNYVNMVCNKMPAHADLTLHKVFIRLLISFFFWLVAAKHVWCDCTERWFYEWWN